MVDEPWCFLGEWVTKRVRKAEVWSIYVVSQRPGMMFARKFVCYLEHSRSERTRVWEGCFRWSNESKFAVCMQVISKQKVAYRYGCLAFLRIGGTANLIRIC